jgi:hypothetical protein
MDAARVDAFDPSRFPDQPQSITCAWAEHGDLRLLLGDLHCGLRQLFLAPAREARGSFQHGGPRPGERRGTSAGSPMAARQRAMLAGS